MGSGCPVLGKLLLIAFAIGVVTGIVQEFQFGMNWSAYSRFVGNIFGAPLAMEASSPSSWNRRSSVCGSSARSLSPRLHLVTIWCAALAPPSAPISSWPPTRGCNIPSATASTHDRCGPVDRHLACPVQSTQLVTFFHTLLGAVLTGGAILLSVSAWHLRKDGERSDRCTVGWPNCRWRDPSRALGVSLMGTSKAKS